MTHDPVARAMAFKEMAQQAIDAYAKDQMVGLVPFMHAAMTDTKSIDDTMFMRLCALLHAEGTMFPTHLFCQQFMNVFNEQDFHASTERMLKARDMLRTASMQIATALMENSGNLAKAIVECMGGTVELRILSPDSEDEQLTETQTPALLH